MAGGIMEIGVPEASAHLGVSEVQVRRLIRQGSLPGRRVGGHWLIDSRALAHLGDERPAGRPMTPRHAWGLIALTEDGKAPFLSASERSRIRARLRRDPALDQVARWCRNRSETTWLRGHPSSIRRVLRFPHAVATGAAGSGHDIIDTRTAEIYLPEDLLASLVSELALEPCSRTEANVVVHLPVGMPQPFPEPTAGPVVTALDLFDAGDSRSRHAGRKLWSRELAARRFDRTRQ